MSDTTTAAPAAAPESTPNPTTESTIPVAESQETSETAETSESKDSTEAKADTKESKDSKKEKSTPKTEAAKKANIKKLKLKIDGKDVEEELNLDDEEGLARHVQMSKVAQKRMQETAELQKQLGAFFQMMNADPEKALSQLGMNVEDFAVKVLQKKIEEEQKSPELREKEKLQKELEELRAAQKQAEENRQQNERSRLQQEQERKIEDGIIGALDTSGLQQKPIVVKRLAEIMLTALDNGIDITPQDAIPILKAELKADMDEYISALPDEAIENLLGKERLSGMRKKQVAAIKKAAESASSIKQTGKDAEIKADAEKKPVKKTLRLNDLLRG